MFGWVSLSVLTVCVLSWPGGVQSAKCPWDEEGLLLWSDSSTWSSGSVPGDNEKVTIPSGKRVLLDVQPASLATLTIEADGALIWGDVDGLVLSAYYILIRGEFHIGSQTCRFQKKAHIRLLGKSNSEHNLVIEDDDEFTFGWKFIGVFPGATLELHGKKKTAWTKLAQTVKPVKDTECALVYDHADTTKSQFALERQNGLHAIVWNEDGSVLDYRVFKSLTKTEEFFASIPDGKVVGMFAFGKDGIGSSAKQLIPTVDAFGGSLIVQVNKGDSYSFLAKKGDPDSVKEFTKPMGQSKYPAGSGFLSLHDPSHGLVFQVSKSTSELFQFFRVVREEAAYPVLTLADEVVGWEEGDEVLVTSTDFDWTQAETRRIMRCDRCPLGKRQIQVDDSFNYLHYGNFTYNVDERAEVAILTRNIFIEGVMEDECYYNNKEEKKLCDKFYRDTFGGHIKIVRGHKSVHVRGVELYHMGQQSTLGRYPLHFHLCADVPGMYLSENSIHHTFSRCITVHGTSHLLVSNNVCYKHFGHGIFTEDGVEQFNTFLGNLVAGTQFGTLLLSDTSKEWCKTDHKNWVENCGDLASYWITHPNNNFTGNVAAGGQGKGFMLVFPDIPLGPSLERQKELGIPHHPKDMPILDFTGNVAHSYEQDGVFMDGKISTGTGMENKGMVPQNGIIQAENQYDPHVDGKLVWTHMNYGTYYKNSKHNMWIKGGNVRVAYSTLADAPQGFAGGTTLTETGTEVYKVLFIGETENKGLGRKTVVNAPSLKQKKVYYFDHSFPGQPTETWTAVSIYQGPTIIKSCFFNNYVTKSWCLDDETSKECPEEELLTRYAGAISFKRSNNYPSMTSSYVQNNTFGYCDNEDGTKHWVFHGNPSIPDWQWKDGNKGVYFFDKDGMLTGTVNASVVSDFPIYKGPECLLRPDWGDLLICPYRYVKLEILGSGGNLQGTTQHNYPMIIQRNDPPYDVPFSIQGEIRNEYLLRTHRSYIIDFNDSRSDAAFPSGYKLYGYGVEKGDVVRVGICQPLDVERFEVVMEYPVYVKNNATWYDNLDDLDADETGNAFFHDKKNGILFFKIMSFHTDVSETERCPQGYCWKVKVNLVGGSVKKMRSCADIPIRPYTATKPEKPLKKIKPMKCPGIGKAEGVGSVNLDKVDFIVQDEFSVPCSTFKQPAESGKTAHLGCFKDKLSKHESQTELIEGELVELVNSMTVEFCINRCYYRGYKYAALSRGRRCTCGNAAMTTGGFVADPGRDCKMKCAGNIGQSCGGKKAFDIWETGY